jgi:glycosyltransferase involved in cell wall biosynthesis
MGVYSEYILKNGVKGSFIENFTPRLARFFFRIQSKFSKLQMPDSPDIQAAWNKKTDFLKKLVDVQPTLPRTWSHANLPRVVHLIGSLQAGGAERQVCNCAIQQKKNGFPVSILITNDLDKVGSHFLSVLNKVGVEVRVAGQKYDTLFNSCFAKRKSVKSLIPHIPMEFVPWVYDIMGELLVDPPDILHSWLDHTNVWGGLAAIMADIPMVVLSTRNVNPMHFPYLATPYFREMYLQFARSKRIRFINNSYAGADDYSRWLGVSPNLFNVILNGVDFSELHRSDNAHIQNFRNEIGVPQEALLVAGVFRLSEEKQPLTFMEVARRIIHLNPNIYFAVAGIGPYEKDVRCYLLKHGLEERIRLLGRRSDIATIFSSATMKMLCSRQEGTPNVLLESQYLGCPVVATKAGGSVDAVKNGSTGFLVDVGNVDELTDASLQILNNADLQKKFASNGPEFIRKRFGLERMEKETSNIYFQ